MRLVSVNVGFPREVISNGNVVLTGIFKAPADGRVKVRSLNLDGDRQADLSVHGGPDKAVYAYPIEAMERALRTPALASSWREMFRARLASVQ